MNKSGDFQSSEICSSLSLLNFRLLSSFLFYFSIEVPQGQCWAHSSVFFVWRGLRVPRIVHYALNSQPFPRTSPASPLTSSLFTLYSPVERLPKQAVAFLGSVPCTFINAAPNTWAQSQQFSHQTATCCLHVHLP